MNDKKYDIDKKEFQWCTINGKGELINLNNSKMINNNQNL
jgi:hypothetical protein